MPGHKKDTIEAEAVVINDWSDGPPITEAELELFERHMFDIITAMIQQG